MMQPLRVEIELPEHLERFHLPRGVDERLKVLLDRQDRGEALHPSERQEAEGLVELAEFLSLLKARSRRVGPET